MNTNAFPDTLRIDEWNFGQIQSAVIPISPAIAAQLLTKNFSTNRKLSPSAIARYASEMVKGEWGVGAGISFSEDGYLVDGQHRLNAVIKAGVEVPFLVTTGVPSDSYRTYDQSMTRTAAHLLTIGGGIGEVKIITKAHVSILRSAMEMVLSSGSHNSPLRTPSAIKQLFPYLIDGIAFALENHQGVTHSAILAVVARAYYSRPHDKLIRFLELVGEPGLACSTSETYASRLPGLLREKGINSSGGWAARSLLSSFTQTALLKFLAGEEWRKGRLFQPTKTLRFECPLDGEIAKILGKSVPELIRGSGSPVNGKVSKVETPDGAIYGTLEQLLKDALHISNQDVTRAALEEIQTQGRWMARSDVKSLIEGLYPSIAGLTVGHTSRQPGSASIASNLMQQVDRGEWREEFPQVVVRRTINKPLLVGVEEC
jgi:hypothetical protein